MRAMREIVDRILQEEQSARSRVERAQNQSQDIVLKAKEEAISLIQDAVNKAKDLSQNNKEEAEKNFLVEKDRILKEAKAGAALSRSRREKDIVKIAGDIFSKIINIKG
jgi:vacuolar-type H+-ATPase subunit H